MYWIVLVVVSTLITSVTLFTQAQSMLRLVASDRPVSLKAIQVILTLVLMAFIVWAAVLTVLSIQEGRWM